MANNINDRYIGLMVRVNDVKRYISEEDMPPYDIEETVCKVLSDAIDTCHAILQHTKNTIMDSKEKFGQSDNNTES